MTNSERPRRRWPSPDEPSRFTWSANLGLNASVRNLAVVLHDLDTATDLGARWAWVLARAEVERNLWKIAVREGPRGVAREAQQAEISEDVFGDIEDLFYRDQWPWSRPRIGGGVFSDLSALIGTIADARLSQVIGNPLTISSAEYRNPLELVLTGSGFMISGALLVLRMVRDWGNTRRRGAAVAQQEEATARRSATQADFMEWLVDEAKHGRLAVPPGDLLGLMTQSDVNAAQRLGAKDTDVSELEPGAEQS